VRPAPTISLQGGNAYVNEMRRLITHFPEVESVVSQPWPPDDGTDSCRIFNAEFFAPLSRSTNGPGRTTRTNLTARCLAKLQDKSRR